MKHVTRLWTVEEVALLKDMRGRVASQDIAHLLGRTRGSIRWMSYFLGIRIRPNRRWRDEEDTFLREKHGVLSNQQIADHLGRTKQAIKGRIRELRLSRTVAPRRWTETEDTYLLLAWQTDKLSDIAIALDRTISAVRLRAKLEHKIRRSPSYYISIGRAHHLFPQDLRDLITINTRLKKGLIDAEHRRSSGTPL
ncbi:hypothetical protein [Variovorax boronicumulans]|uniref:hypothetical protein n=1 Tax=Variovorax boronicumulans TaxID=436515 RepID=UPI003393B672